jgi:hypothetical protein
LLWADQIHVRVLIRGTFASGTIGLDASTLSALVLHAYTAVGLNDLVIGVEASIHVCHAIDRSTFEELVLVLLGSFLGQGQGKTELLLVVLVNQLELLWILQLVIVKTSINEIS